MVERDVLMGAGKREFGDMNKAHLGRPRLIRKLHMSSFMLVNTWVSHRH